MRRKEVTYHKLKKNDIDMFALELVDMDLKGDNLDSITSKVETKVKQTLEKHAPEGTKKITKRIRHPRFDDNIKTLRDTCIEERRCGESEGNCTSGEPLEKHSATKTQHYKPRR